MWSLGEDLNPYFRVDSKLRYLVALNRQIFNYSPAADVHFVSPSGHPYVSRCCPDCLADVCRVDGTEGIDKLPARILNQGPLALL